MRRDRYKSLSEGTATRPRVGGGSKATHAQCDVESSHARYETTVGLHVCRTLPPTSVRIPRSSLLALTYLRVVAANLLRDCELALSHSIVLCYVVTRLQIDINNDDDDLCFTDTKIIFINDEIGIPIGSLLI